jgi:hypothetical protein
MRSAKQRAAIAQWKTIQRGLIQPKPPAPAESWWTQVKPGASMTAAAKAEQPRMQGSTFGSIGKNEG